MSDYTDTDVRREIRAMREWLAAERAASTLAADTTGEGGYCPECDEYATDERFDTDRHIVRKGYVLVGCQGYYTATFLAAVRAYLKLRDANFRFQAGHRVSPVAGDRQGTVLSSVSGGQLGGGTFVTVAWDNTEGGTEVWWQDITHAPTVRWTPEQ